MALGFLGTVAGCFQGKPVKQYTLTTTTSILAEPASPALSSQEKPMTILIGPVKLASYLDQPRIVKRSGTTRIEAYAGQQWAGDLAEMIQNKLLAELGALLKPFPVYSYPITTTLTQGRRVAIDILRFEGTENQTADIEARWTLFDLGSKSIIKTQSAFFHITLSDNSYEALAIALSQGLTMLVGEITLTLPEANR
jgi:uncharacterized lipoprotein YmbA